MKTKITFTLEVTRQEAFRPKRVGRSDLRIVEVEIPCALFNRFLYQAVGREYRWAGRRQWNRQAWQRFVDRPQLRTWVAYVRGTPAGYFELEEQDDGSVRIQTFGLLGDFIGQGLGGHLLSVAVEQAWEWGANRIWLTTCSHDHPHALANYQARGFQVAGEATGPANPPWDADE